MKRRGFTLLRPDTSEGILRRSIVARGFTMMEMTFVISIIAVLAAILFPVFARAREAARRTSCASNLSQLGGALNMYAQAYDGRYPKKNNQFGAVYSYTHSIDIFYCPSDSTERTRDVGASPSPGTVPFADSPAPKVTYSSYVYRGGLSNDSRGDAVIAGEAQAWHGDLVNVLYVGGYVKGVRSSVYKPVVAPMPKPKAKPAVPPAPPPGSPPAPGG
jgi:prepilin-type N-terminal cleavage/methylation domain-containing protein